MCIHFRCAHEEECVKKNIRKWKLEIPIKKLKPITSGTRHMSILVNTELDKVRPEKTLVEPLSSSYGIETIDTEQEETDTKVTRDYIE